MKPAHWLFIFIGLLTLLRLAYIGQMELAPDEAYYYMWSQRPDLAYYSKGPGVAMALAAGTSIFGENEFGVRFLSPLLAAGTSLLVFFLARRLYNEAMAVWTVLGINLVPIFAVGALLMTIDPLSILFWTAGLFTFWLAIEQSPRFSFYWPATGLLIGAGFLCKYTNALQLVSVILMLAMVPALRREFARPGFYTLLAIFAVCTLPPIIWNAQREWITLAHLSARGGLDSAFRFSPGDLLEFIGAHFGVYSPLIFLAVIAAIWWAWPQRAERRVLFLLVFGLPLLVLYLLLALKRAGEANWTAPAFVSLGILTGGIWYVRAQQSKANAKFMFAALALALAMSLLIMNTDAARAVGIPWAYKRDPSARLRGWMTTANTVAEIRRHMEREKGEELFLIANKYQTAAELAFYLPEKREAMPGHPPVYIPESQMIQNQFSFWPRYEEFVESEEGPADEFFTEEAGINPFVGRSALYVTDRAEGKAPSTVAGAFENVKMVREFTVYRRGQPLRTIRVFFCDKYRSLPL